MTSVTQRLSALEAAVFECVAYSDVFDYAVTASEVLRALPMPATLAEVEAALVSEVLSPGLIEHSHGYYTLSQRGHLVATRLLRGNASQRLVGKARLYGTMIARLPYVRMVAITGSLAVDNADEGDDIDYLIVTAPGRVWLARALTMAVVRLAALRGVTVCPNYLLSEGALALPEQDRYTARELLQMRPLGGDWVYRRMLAANGWWRDYLPNASAAAAVGNGGGRLQRLGELLLGSVASGLESWVYRRKAAELTAQAEAGNGEVVFDATMCKGHFEGHRRRLAEALALRLRRLEEPLP